MFNFYFLYYCTLSLVFYASGLRFSSDAVIDLPSILNSGQQQLKSLEAKAKAPVFGECWARAVSNLEVGCRTLTEELQSVLALRLTDCFLQSAGHGPIVCDVPRKECLQQLSDRSFNAYTEFYTHTQSICYFLQSKLWHEETEKTIDKLSYTSQKVTSQLADAEKGQNALLKQQRESLDLQETLALNLAASKDTINLLIDDLKTTAENHKAGLVTLFEQLSALQSWLIGEISWMDSLLFYSTASLVAFLFTSSRRTQAARLLLFSLLSLNYVVERYICSVNNESYFASIFSITEEIKDWVWLSRKVAMTVGAVIVFICYLTYNDYNIMNHRLLIDIKKQNELLVNLIGREHTEPNQASKPSDFVAIPHCIPLPFHSNIPSLHSSYPGNPGRGLCSVNGKSHSAHQNGHRAPSLEPFLRKFRKSSLDVESQASSDTASESSDRSVRRSSRLRRVVPNK